MASAGSNNYTVYVVDVSGSKVANISGGWVYSGNIGGTTLNFAGTTVSPISADAGIYIHNINDIAGTGYIRIQRPPYTVNSAYNNFGEFPVNNTTYDADDIFGRFLASTTVNAGSSTATVSYSSTCNDDFIKTISIDTTKIDTGYGLASASISGCSFSVGSTTPLITGGSVTIETQTAVLVNIPKALLPSSLAKTSIPLDLQLISPTGKKLTVLKMTLNMLQDYDPL
jgi:hypothetical protein